MDVFRGMCSAFFLILKPKNWIPKTCTQSGKYYSLYFEGVIAKPRIFYFFRLSGAQSCKVGWDGNFILIQAFEHDHGLRTPNEGINQRYLRNWADVADKI